MFLCRRKTNKTQKSMEQMKENNYKLEIARRDRQISMLEVELELKKCKDSVDRLKGVVDRWQK